MTLRLGIVTFLKVPWFLYLSPEPPIPGGEGTPYLPLTQHIRRAEHRQKSPPLGLWAGFSHYS